MKYVPRLVTDRPLATVDLLRSDNDWCPGPIPLPPPVIYPSLDSAVEAASGSGA